MTVAEMGDAMGLAKTSMRQHIERLDWGGWVDRTRRPHGPGRPTDVFSLSDQGRGLFSRQSDEFAGMLLEEIAEQEGPARLRTMVQGVGRRLIRKLGPRVTGTTMGERLDRLVELLGERGVVSDVARSDGGATLKIHTCLYHGLVDEHPELCEMERSTVSQLLGTETRLSRCIRDGEERCELQMMVPDETGGPGPAKASAAAPEGPAQNETEWPR